MSTTIHTSFKEYLELNPVDRSYELIRGKLVEIRLPRVRHILIAKFLERTFDNEIKRLNLNLVALREAGVQTEYDSCRLPDIIVVSSQQVKNLLDRPAVFQVPALIAVEIVSPSSVSIDCREKPCEYANKGINEYWIVDPIAEKITILLLQSGIYQTQTFTNAESIGSNLFPDLNLTVKQILQAK